MSAYAERLLREALEEEAREGGSFDRWSFDAFFPEDLKTARGRTAVALAWAMYIQQRGGK